MTGSAVPALLLESYRGSLTRDDIATSHRSADQRKPAVRRRSAF
jgi:hypothetical protein